MPFPTVNLTPGSGVVANTLPNAGQTTMAESLSVTVASNQSAIKVNGNAGPANIATAQVSVSTTATLLAASRTDRNAITIVNMGTTDVFLGDSGVTTSNGVKLKGIDGASFTIPFTGALYGRVASGTQSVGVLEAY